jgi:hypothetical protein
VAHRLDAEQTLQRRKLLGRAAEQTGSLEQETVELRIAFASKLAAAARDLVADLLGKILIFIRLVRSQVDEFDVVAIRGKHAVIERLAQRVGPPIWP